MKTKKANSYIIWIINIFVLSCKYAKLVWINVVFKLDMGRHKILYTLNVPFASTRVKYWKLHQYFLRIWELCFQLKLRVNFSISARAKLALFHWVMEFTPALPNMIWIVAVVTLRVSCINLTMVSPDPVFMKKEQQMKTNVTEEKTNI